MEAMSIPVLRPAATAVESSPDGVVGSAQDPVRRHRLSLIARGRRARLAATVVVVFALAGVNVGNHVLGWDTMWLGPVGAVALLAFARWQGLTWHQLGLARHTHARGIRWGLGVIAVVGFVYLVGILLPSTRTAFLDVRYHLPPAGALLTAFVMIPVGTILLEEVAFRSVLWGFLSRHARMWQVLLVSSLLFGLWHVFPAMASATGNPAIGSAVAGLGPLARVAVVGGTVLFTALGGVLAGELRRRSGSLFASVGMHWATNALGVLFGVLAWRLAA
jgi:membrane protease YdiL (CAAX protease family)